MESQLKIIEEKENDFGGKSRRIPNAISQERFIALELKIGTREKSKFKEAVKDYHCCFVTNRYPRHNGKYYDVIKNSDFDNLEVCIKALIKFCKLR